ncbi:MAG TPA: phosphoserine phosphatase SerB [Alphaproteobacteria bacterium]|nr:phosphoserine phosphatase SerB [Alphaproteobacteria bacterium]
MQRVLTIVAGDVVAGLENSIADSARAALKAAGAGVGFPRTLQRGLAVDLPFEGVGDAAAEHAVRAHLQAGPFDLLAQPVEGRRKRLLVADMDSTIVGVETLDELADFAGVKDLVAAITARSMAGEVDFVDALIERVAMLKGLSVDALERTWERVFLLPGARALVETMRHHGGYTALVSGGFRFFTSRVRALVGFDYDESNTLEIEDGRLTGRIVPPVINRDGKFNALKRLCEERGLPLAASLAVGDGANDLAMVRAAGLGIAYRGKPSLAAAARARVDHADLTALLFFQGYARDEFVE